MKTLFVSFFIWLGGVLSDPNDKQGSTQRVCLFLFLGTIMSLICFATYRNPAGTLPTIPGSILELIYYVVGVLTGGIAIAKGIAAYKAVNAPGGNNEPVTISPTPAEPIEPATDQQP